MSNSSQLFHPPLVMSVHGIRTHAEWQMILSELLNQENIQFKHRRFGYYPIASFVRPAKNQRMVDLFFDWYNDVLERSGDSIDLDDPRKRPSIIAHSLGSFIVGYSMLKYPEIKFDKVILCGSILPRDFDWHTLFVRDQVFRIRNETGGRDIWVSAAPHFVRGTGDSGRHGFGFLSNRCRNEAYDYHEHSDFFKPGHIRGTWLPFLRTSPAALAVKNGADIADEREYARLIHRTRAIDRIRFGRIPHHEEVAIPFGYSVGWRHVNPDIYSFLYDRRTGKACGYINAMPLEEEAYQKILTGELRDNQIPPAAVVPYLQGQKVKIYLMSIALAPNIETAGEGLFSQPRETLLDAFFGKLIFYARMHNIQVEEVAAVGWTDEGKRICERLFRMKKLGTDAFENPIYTLRLSTSETQEIAKMHRGLQKLIQTYNQLKAEE